MTADRVLAHVRATGLLPAGGAVVVMLSGGRDSTCLLDVARRLVGPGCVSALHVNYGLRAEADGDQTHCEELCAATGIELAVERVSAPRRGNLHAWARDARYGAAARLALERRARVAAGHTATDQAETVLYRLAASPGRRALLGMPARDGRLVRPLLEVTREQTAAYCRERGLAWREDAANDDPVYARARVRGGLVPELRAVHPAAERNVVRTAARLRDEADVLDAAVDDVLGGRGALAGAELAALPAALARLVLRRLAEDAAGRPAPDASERLAELVALTAAPGSAELSLQGGLRAVSEYGTLRFAASAEPAVPVSVRLGVPGDARFGAWEVRARSGPPTPRDGVLDAEALG
ncbi:MAG TPA: tRNA lysidine(34) synthetase TilS, partial [Solirubrobacteraceae bacterium]|nr:tRNA lysidine(34) synthetase TilS [Solirubrobacteraceae bacterium]